MNRSQADLRHVFASPVLAGAILLAVGLVGLLLSYNANKGLPYVPVYEVNADLPDAAELKVGASEVRASGARVGIVKKITAMPSRGGKPAFARVKLDLETNLKYLPVDSTVQVRPRSVLGAKYLDLTIGKSKHTLPPGAVLPISQAKPIVELDEAFNAFDKQTNRGIRQTIDELGDSFAARGTSINEAIGSIHRGILPFQRVTRTLIAPSTDLPGFLRGLAGFTGALAPVSDRLAALFDHGATTFGAIDAAGNSLGRTIDELSATERVGTPALQRIGPVLSDTAALAAGLQPGVRELPRASRRLAVTLEEGTRSLGNARAAGDLIRAAFQRLARIVDSPHASSTLRNLEAAVLTVREGLTKFNPAQVQCNIVPEWGFSVAGSLLDGDADGAWITIQPLMNVGQILQESVPSPDLHVNPIPHENYSECEAGNEPYRPGQMLGNPPGNQSNTTTTTAPPSGVRALARRAGLLASSAGQGLASSLRERRGSVSK
jgi:virulence factor Mce-like protein